MFLVAPRLLAAQCDKRRKKLPLCHCPLLHAKETSLFGLLSAALVLPVSVCRLPVVLNIVPVEAAYWSWCLMYPF